MAKGRAAFTTATRRRKPDRRSPTVGDKSDLHTHQDALQRGHIRRAIGHHDGRQRVARGNGAVGRCLPPAEERGRILHYLMHRADAHDSAAGSIRLRGFKRWSDIASVQRGQNRRPKDKPGRDCDDGEYQGRAHYENLLNLQGPPALVRRSAIGCDDRWIYFFANSASITFITSGSSGEVPGLKRATTLPSRPITNFSKFQSTLPGPLGDVFTSSRCL